MKTNFLLLLLLSLLIGASCKKDDGLTPETQTGANTFSCLINGKLFLPKRSLFSGEPLYGVYNATNKNLSIGASNSFNGNNTNINIVFDNSYEGIGLYSLNPNNATGHNVNISYRIGSPTTRYYYAKLTGEGNVTITKSNNNVVSGTFEFVAQNDNDANDKIVCTRGRFDLVVSGVK